MKTILKYAMMATMTAFMLSACKNSGEAEQEAANYSLLTVTTDSVTLTEAFTANIQGQQDVEIMPQVSGTIKKVCIVEGQAVKKGQTLFVINPVPFEAAHEQSVANVHAAEAALSSARLDYESVQTLFCQNIVGQFEVSKAESAVATARAALEQARAAEKEVRWQLSYTSVKSPADGVVGTLPYRVGTLVSPQMPKPLTTVSDCAAMWVYFSLSEKMLRTMQRPYGSRQKMLEAMPEVRLRLSDGTLYDRHGRIESISGVVNPSTGSVQIRATFPNPDDELLSGSIGDILIPQTFSDAIVIPMSATYELQDHVYVSLVNGGRVVKRRIMVSRLSDSHNYIVTAGLTPGDIIIAEGPGLVREGEEIQTQETSER